MLSFCHLAWQQHSHPRWIHRPSSITDAELGDILDPSIGFTEWSLMALHTITSVDFAGAVHSAQELRAGLGRLKLQDQCGLYCTSKASPSGELACTSIIGSVLARCFSTCAGRDLRWYHQLPAAGGTTDILVSADIACDGQGGIRAECPIAVFEFGWVGSNKKPQCFAYGSNLSTLLGSQTTPILAITWYMHLQHNEGNFEVHILGFHPSHAAAARMSAIPVWKANASEENIARLLTTVSEFGRRAMGPLPSEWEYPSRTVAIEKPKTKEPAIVHKVYDYRLEMKGDIPKEQRRRHQQMHRFGPRVEYELGSENSDLVVLKYPFIEGCHTASTVGHFVSALSKIMELHEAGIIHGDIRASNLIFESNGDCTLIDFDLAGSVSDKYPPQFVCIGLGDVIRHEGARPEEHLAFEHDWHALASIMRMHTCLDQNSAWEEAIKQIELGEPRNALSILDKAHHTILKPLDSLTVSMLGTGTPPKALQGAKAIPGARSQKPLLQQNSRKRTRDSSS